MKTYRSRLSLEPVTDDNDQFRTYCECGKLIIFPSKDSARLEDRTIEISNPKPKPNYQSTRVLGGHIKKWIKRGRFSKKLLKPDSNDPCKLSERLNMENRKMKIAWALRTLKIKKKEAINNIFEESCSSARDKIFAVAIFFGTSSQKLFNPSGGVDSDGVAQAKDCSSYMVFRTSMLGLFLVAVLVCIDLNVRTPKSRKERQVQLKRVELLTWLGLFVYLIGCTASYIVINANPFQDVSDWLVLGCIGLSAIGLIAAGAFKN